MENGRMYGLSCIQKENENTRKSKRQKNLGLAATGACEMICRLGSLLCCSPLTFIALCCVFFFFKVHLMFPKLNSRERGATEVPSLARSLAPLCSSETAACFL